MSAFPLTRRAALGILALSPAVAVRSALAQPNVRFRNIVVDVTPLARQRRRSDRRLGAASASRRARAVARRLHRPWRPARRDPDSADRRSLSRADTAGPAFLAVRRTRSTARWSSRARVAGSRPKRPIRAITSYHQTPVDQPLRVEFNYWRVVWLGAGVRGLGAERARALDELEAVARNARPLSAPPGGDECRSAP